MRVTTLIRTALESALLVSLYSKGIPWEVLAAFALLFLQVEFFILYVGKVVAQQTDLLKYLTISIVSVNKENKNDETRR